ncbi:uncharacterized protein METZ01_LOCUS428277, partial [marine metagenome]
NFAASTVGGALSATATTGNITQSGALAITGVTTIAADSGNNITLNNTSNNFQAAVRITSGNDVTLVDAGAIILGASTVSGALSVTATTGNITQSGALDIEGATTLVTAAQGATIDLSTVTTNAFTSQLLITTNDNEPADGTYAAHVKIDGGTTNLIIGTSTIDGDLTLLSGGTITDTDSSTVTVKGALSATTDAGSSLITLNDLEVDGSFTLAPNSAGAVTIVNDAGLDLAASTMGGTFSGTATTGDISDSGTLTITGAATFITTAA